MIVQVLRGWTASLMQTQVPNLDQHSGLPLIKDGQADTKTVYTLVFVEKNSKNEIHYAFDESEKDVFVQALTGGIVVANGMPSV